MRTLSQIEMHHVSGGNGDTVTPTPTPTPAPCAPVTSAPVLPCLSLIKLVVSLPKFCLPKVSLRKC